MKRFPAFHNRFVGGSFTWRYQFCDKCLLMQRVPNVIMDFTVSEKIGQIMSGRRKDHIVYCGHSEEGGEIEKSH